MGNAIRRYLKKDLSLRLILVQSAFLNSQWLFWVTPSIECAHIKLGQSSNRFPPTRKKSHVSTVAAAARGLLLFLLLVLHDLTLLHSFFSNTDDAIDPI